MGVIYLTTVSTSYCNGYVLANELSSSSAHTAHVFTMLFFVGSEGVCAQG